MSEDIIGEGYSIPFAPDEILLHPKGPFSLPESETITLPGIIWDRLLRDKKDTDAKHIHDLIDEVHALDDKLSNQKEYIELLEKEVTSLNNTISDLKITRNCVAESICGGLFLIILLILMFWDK